MNSSRTVAQPAETNVPLKQAKEMPRSAVENQAGLELGPPPGPAARPGSLGLPAHNTLKYSLLGPSLLKAGQESVDQSKVCRF